MSFDAYEEFNLVDIVDIVDAHKRNDFESYNELMQDYCSEYACLKSDVIEMIKEIYEYTI